MIEQLQNKLFDDFKSEWNRKLLSDNSIGNNNGGNKLRTYRLFKHDYQVEFYVKANFIPRGNRSVLAKFSTGVAPLRVETGRYASLPVEQRVLTVQIRPKMRNTLRKHAYSKYTENFTTKR